MSIRTAREKAEAALRAWLIARAPGSDIADIRVVQAREPSDFTFPLIVFESTRAIEHTEGSEWYLVDLIVHLYTQIDEAADSGALHAKRVGCLQEIFVGDQTAMLAAVNPPVPGAPDTRAVKDFQLIALWTDEESGEQTDRHWYDLLRFKALCIPHDGVS